MIHERAIAKITDFGVARIQSHQMTQAGSMVGTPNYMSPEQIQGQPVDGRSDQFSLAVIAYELLTGEKPFSADSIPSLAFKIVQEEPPQVHRLNPTLEWPVDTVLRRALSKNPADRYPTCSDFAFAIENACRSSKKWKPVAAGALQNLPTLSGHARTPPAPAAKQAPAEPKVRPMAAGILNPPVNPSTEAPRLLRWARGLVLAIVGGAVIFAAILGALHFMENGAEERNAAAPSSAKDETAVVIPPKPSAMPTQPEAAAPTPPAEVPADAPSTIKEETQPAAPPKTERATSKPASSVTRMVTNPPGSFWWWTGVLSIPAPLRVRWSCRQDAIPLWRLARDIAAR